MDARSEWLLAAERYLAACRETSTSVRASEFALQMDVTPARLARDFHASVGLCVKSYFMVRQLERAQELLRTTEHGMTQIASDAGYGTARSFFRAFRKFTGMTPAQYRQKMSLASPE